MAQRLNLIDVKFKVIWFVLAFALSLIVPNGVFVSLWCGMFGRLYIVYFVVFHLESLREFAQWAVTI